MKILAVGDLHVQVNNLQYTRVLFDNLLNLSLKRKVDVVIFLGDLFHTHAVVRQEVVDELQRGFYNFKANGIKTISLVGNHDGISPYSINTNAVSLTLKHLTNVIDCPTDTNQNVFYILDKSSKSLLAFMPYEYNPELFVNNSKLILQKASCEEDISQYRKYLFCHQPFQGACYENGYGCVEPSPSPNDLYEYDLIISGHIHKRQVLNNGKVFYVGTPRPVSMSEVNDDKIVVLLDASTGNIDLIPTKELGMPHYYLLNVNLDKNTLEEAVLQIREFKEKNKYNQDLDILIVNVTCQNANLMDGLKVLLGSDKIRWVYVPSRSELESNNVQMSPEVLSWEDIINKYISINNLIPNELKEKVYEESIKLWKEVK